MATKNGNILPFKTAKLKETTKILKSVQKGSGNLSGGVVASATPPIIGSSSMSNVIKINNIASATMATSGNTVIGGKRVWPSLPSFAPPRDLTLGGRAPKKVFTPNLNAVRNKNLNVKTSKDTTLKRGGGRGGRGNARGAATGRGGKTSTLIQTKGVFSEGAGDFNVRRNASYSRFFSGGGNEDTAVAIPRPVLSKDDKKKIDMKADEKKLYEITGASDEEECFDYDKTFVTEDDLPIRLNEAPAFNVHKLQKLHFESKEMDLQDPQNVSHHSALPRYPKSVNDFLDSTKTQLFLLQLPDILPCETDTDSKDISAKKEQKPQPAEPESSSGTTRLNLKSDYNWKTMQEGQIGKVVRYKSGKVRLLLGKTLFDLDVAMEPGFMQDVISIRTNEVFEHSTGSMINLGPIHAKINSTPYWEDCMHHFESETVADNV